MLQPLVQAVVAAWQAIVEYASAIVVKIIRRYWRDVHPILVRYGLAPMARSAMARRKLWRYVVLKVVISIAALAR